MVSICESADWLGFLPADPFAARITALFDTYGADYGFAKFWVQTVDGVQTAAISSIDGEMTLCCLENTDFEELSAFINAVGYSSVTCRAEHAAALGLKVQKSSHIVRFEGNSGADCNGISRDFDKRKIYDLLCLCGFELGAYEAFLADVCSRLNKGTASIAVIENGGEPLACAFVLFKGRKSVLLGAVATNPSARGRGYASRAVSLLANENSEKRVFLFCRNDGLADFYGKIGFQTDGRWAVAVKS